MLPIISIDKKSLKEAKAFLSKRFFFDTQTKNTVQKILADIQKNGHKAVVKYAKKYDLLKSNQLSVSKATLEKQASLCPAPVKTAIRAAIKNIRSFHQKQKESSWIKADKYQVKRGQLIRPLERVGIYVPGGSGVYPSSVMMNAIPAQIAGVSNIIVTTPTNQKIDPSVAFALEQLKINEVYQIGGAQAIGLLAYGTDQVKPVDKIVGPGNNFVSLAKKEVFGTVDIDMIAGPSEILVICSPSADPDWVAADLLSQAEHGSGREAALCITKTKQHAQFILECLKQQVLQSPKKELLKKTLKKYGRIFVVPSFEVGCEFANLIAPEHLELMTDNNPKWIKEIKNAGAIFDGPYSSEPVGDYFAGPNHVLPTHGTARFFSPLGVYDFYKRTSYLKYSHTAIQKEGKKIIALAEHEGFIHHADAIRKRLD